MGSKGIWDHYLQSPSLPLLQVAYDDDGGVGFGSKITLSAEAGTEYYIVLEPCDSSTCGLANVVLGESLTSAPMSPLSPPAPSPPQGT